MCKSKPSGPSQAEIDLMNAQTAQIPKPASDIGLLKQLRARSC